jgi:hypothetical protein
MYKWIVSLANWCIQPVSGGFAELDQQIMKFRLLKEAYASDRSFYCPEQMINSSEPKK